MTSLCNNIISLVEFILKRFMADIYIVLKSSQQEAEQWEITG